MAGGTAQHLEHLPRIGIIGATSFVGRSLLAEMSMQQHPVVAFTRKEVPAGSSLVHWVKLQELDAQGATILSSAPIEHWILLAPIWAMPAYFPIMQQLGARSVVALSSTSVITKRNSKDIVEQTTISRMLAAEKALETWATEAGIRWAVLRPTLIYGHGLDKNLSEIARIIRKTHVFPLLGSAAGKRQPVHVDDVARACLATLTRPSSAQSIYTVSGSEILPYHEMVRRVFNALNLTPRFVPIPAALFEWAVKGMQLVPRYRSWTPSMAERMNLDMAFDHDAAQRDFGFQPRAFDLRRDDLP